MLLLMISHFPMSNSGSHLIILVCSKFLILTGRDFLSDVHFSELLSLSAALPFSRAALVRSVRTCVCVHTYVRYWAWLWGTCVDSGINMITGNSPANSHIFL